MICPFYSLEKQFLPVIFIVKIFQARIFLSFFIEIYEK